MRSIEHWAHTFIGVEAHINTNSHTNSRTQFQHEMRSKSMEIICWNEIPISNGIQAHEWHCHDESVNGSGPFIWTIQAHRIQCSVSVVPLTLPPLLKTSKRFAANADEISTSHNITRHNTKRKNNRIVHGLFIYEAVKLTFQTLALNYLRMKNVNNNKNQRRASKLNLIICVSVAEKISFSSILSLHA